MARTTAGARRPKNKKIRAIVKSTRQPRYTAQLKAEQDRVRAPFLFPKTQLDPELPPQPSVPRRQLPRRGPTKQHQLTWLSEHNRRRKGIRIPNLKAHPELRPSPEPEEPALIVPMVSSPYPILKEWDNDALAAVWAHYQKSIMQDMVAVKLELIRACDMAEYDLQHCLDIIKDTSMPAYKSSTVGWHVRSKRKEMADQHMVYLLLRAAPHTNATFSSHLSTNILGFTSFMITYDDPPFESRKVVYIYEIHLGDNFRGQGIGRFLISTVEAMASTAGVNKTMLTVFASNKGAIKAYKRMGYARDQATPPDRQFGRLTIKCDYLIMSKSWSLETGEVIESNSEPAEA